jgi:uncharacterized protein (TIGR03067 family)
VPEELDMKSLRWPVVFGVVCAVVAVATAQPGADDAKKLGGTWVVESTSREKELANPWKGGQFVFAGDTVTVKLPGEKEQTFTFTVDPAKVPKVMDFAPQKNSKQAPWALIYELDGDSLRLCVAYGDKRASTFTNKDGLVVVLKRKK